MIIRRCRPKFRNCWRYYRRNDFKCC